MPQETFFNLPDDKRNLIISSAMQEFSQSNYNTASINQICKKAKIAKGSFYQYFNDKLDLYVYIMTTECKSERRNRQQRKSSSLKFVAAIAK